MKIMQNTYALFWTRKGWKKQFHADVPADVPAPVAVSRFRDMFPDDVVCSVRDASGRFVAFQERSHDA